ncbi:MAG TPA: ATP-binding protein, partial [Ktedonobacteraceae bacterium]
MFSLHRQPDNLVTLLQELLGEHGDAMGSTLHIDIPATELTSNIDRERISQVILNLLSNARKYSPANSPITVKLERQDDHAVITVIDQGVGIPPEKLAHIFERFYRVPEIDVQTGSSSGVGLGLYIAQKIVERHDGRLSVTSNLGQGSTFTIHLPLLINSEQSTLTNVPDTLEEKDVQYSDS